MAQAAWEKPIAARQLAPRRAGIRRWQFLVGGLVILAAVVYLVISGTLTGAQYFITVDQLLNTPAYAGQTVRVTGAVIGDSIKYDEKNLLITFTVANVPISGDDLGALLHTAVTDPKSTHLNVRVEDTVKPELLQNEAQAVMTGTLGTDGVFHVTELNLKCPSKFIADGPSEQSITAGQGQQSQAAAPAANTSGA